MNSYAERSKNDAGRASSSDLTSGKSSIDNRNKEVVPTQLPESINSDVGQLRTYQEMADNSPQVRQLQEIQAMADRSGAHVAQRREEMPGEKPGTAEAQENETGLPDGLKSGIEDLSGLSMNDVKVHYNSAKPAQLQAHAYAQGTEIHVAPGQEKHLPHEAWHVVQQKRERVRPTLQMKSGVAVNDDRGLEQEADMMGEKALIQGAFQLSAMGRSGDTLSSTTVSPTRVVQRAIAGGDLEGGGVPADHLQRVLNVLNDYNEAKIRESLDEILVIFSTVQDWPAYTDQDIREVIRNYIPLFTLNAGASNNPWLHILEADFGVAVPRLLVDDSNNVDNYIAIAQTCSVMSIVWLRDSRAAGNYSIRTAGNPEAVARTIFANQSPDDQFTWAEQQTALTRVNARPTLQQLRDLGEGGRFILYSPVHVSAGIISEGRFLYYDPETGSASIVSDGEMGIYIAAAQRYLHS